MTAKYNNNNNSQTRMCQILQGMALACIMAKQSCDTSTTLEKLCDIITTSAPQGPISYRTEEAKIEYLHNTLAGIDWAQPARTQCYARDPPWTFYHLYTALDTSWLQYQRTTKTPPTMEDSIDVLFGS